MTPAQAREALRQNALPQGEEMNGGRQLSMFDPGQPIPAEEPSNVIDLDQERNKRR